MGKYKLLVVDDSPEDVETYKRHLKNLSSDPIEIVVKESGASAIHYLDRNFVDCIFLDYQLPDISGLDFFKKIKESIHHKIPVIMLTGQGNEKVAVEALKLGVYDYLIKDELQAAQLYQAMVNGIQRFQLDREVDTQRTQIEYMAFHDALTGLANRRQYEVFAEKILASANRQKKKFAILALDLDGFKLINDEFGHETGDLLLKEVAARFSQLIRKNDILARLGGDEFWIILENLERPETPEIVSRKIIESLNRGVMINGKMLLISVSIGFAIFPDQGASLSDLQRKADSALYAAKEAGKNQFFRANN